MPPLVLHLVISLAPGGLERLVVDWTNVRNGRHPGSTRICCLDEPGDLAGQVEESSAFKVQSSKFKNPEVVFCVGAKRARWPFELAAVRRIRDELLSCADNRLPPVVLHAHNLAAWHYAVLAKLLTKISRTPVWGGCPHPPGDPGGREGLGDIRPAVHAPLPLRLIYTQHGANVHNMSLRDRIRARLLACFTSEIVAVSKATAEVMARNMWVKRARIKVVVNGVAVSEQEREAQGGSRRPRWLIDGVDSRIVRRDAECHLAVPPLASRVGSATAFRIKCGIPADARVIGTVGRLAHVKGTDRLIAAFAAIPQQLSSCQVAQLLSDNPEISPPSATQQPSNLTTYLLLVGDGPERVNLERQARELGVADRVIFAGYQADPAPCLAAMDVFVLPSRSEGVSVALLEAMAAGIPVAVTDVGANREVIEEGQCGVILPEDERQWPEIVAAMLMGPEANALKARAARERVRTHYSLETTLDGYESLYL